MPMTKDQILAEARSLTAEERDRLVEDLLSLDDVAAGRDAADLAEARRRDAEFAAGGQQTIPVGDVVARLLGRGKP